MEAQKKDEKIAANTLAEPEDEVCSDTSTTGEVGYEMNGVVDFHVLYSYDAREKEGTYISRTLKRPTCVSSQIPSILLRIKRT